MVFVQKEDGKLQQVHPDQEQHCRVWKWTLYKPGDDSSAGEYSILDDVDNIMKTATVNLLWLNTDSLAKPEPSELAKLVNWDDMPGWSMTGVPHLWEDVSRVADSKACIQQQKFIVNDTLHAPRTS